MHNRELSCVGKVRYLTEEECRAAILHQKKRRTLEFYLCDYERITNRHYHLATVRGKSNAKSNRGTIKRGNRNSIIPE